MQRLTAPRSSPRRRRLLASVAGLVLAAMAGTGAGAFAADSPSEAVETLVDRIVSGAFDDLTGVVCPEVEDDIRAEFDPSGSDMTFGAVHVAIADPVVTVVREDEGRAIVNLTGSMRITFDEEQARAFVREQLEGSGETPTDEEVDTLLGLMFPSEDLPVDEDLTVLERDGEWLVCDASDTGGSFSDTGICGLVAPEEIGALAPIPLVSNVGEGDFCQWIGADDDGYFSIDVGLLRDASLDDYRDADPDAQSLTVGGLPAIGSEGAVYVAVDGGVLSVSPYLTEGPDPSADPIALATSVAELFLPRLGLLPASDLDAGDGGLDGSVPLADCSIIDLESINALSGVVYDSVSSSDGTCTFVSSEIDAGTPFLSVGIDPASTIADLSFLFPDGKAGEVDGHESLGAVDTLWVQLDEGLLTVSPNIAGSPEASGVDLYAYAADVARIVIAALADAG